MKLQDVPSIRTKNSKVKKREASRTILLKKWLDGKLEVRQYSCPDDITEEGYAKNAIKLMARHQDGPMSTNKAYQSGIVLFDGKASKLGIILRNFFKWNFKSRRKTI